MPFLVVQLPNVKHSRSWPITRAAQARAVRSLPNVGMVVTIDGTSIDLHPPDKQPVAHRLALLAQKLAYGMDVVASGPTFKSMRIDGNAARLAFDHVEGGLIAKGDALQGFQVAGGDGQFVPARATIDGDTVMVTADGVESPKTVRYAWENDPKATLYNKADLPAAPFQAAAE